LWLTVQPGAWAVPGDIAGTGTDEPDGFVGIDDLNRVLGNWNVTCDPGDWTKGDIDGDGFVSQPDLSIILAHFNQSDPDPFIGTNLAPVVYWNTSWAFVDAMKMARPWRTDFDDALNLPVPTDANGWPTQNPVKMVNGQPVSQTVFTHVFGEMNGAYPAGSLIKPYILTWEGDADITPDLTWDADSYTIPDPVNNPRRMLITVTPDNQGIRLLIDNIDTNNPIKNIRLWMPGFENPTSSFHPLFVKRLKTFKVLRFMDWQKTNSSTEVTWSDRKRPTYAFQNDSRDSANGNHGGVALEYIIELCNELEADPWFCMPHQADDDYVTQFARMVRDGDPPNNVPPLHAGAKIYVEYSNELWNTAPGFNQWKWIEDQANARLGIIDPNDPDYVQIRDNEWFDQWAIEAINDYGIWKAEFANDSRPLVRVLAGQKALVWILQKMIPRMIDPGDPNGKDVLFDGLACSTYFDNAVSGSTPEAVLQNTLDRIVTDDTPDYESHSLLARELSDPNYTNDNPDKYTGRVIPFISYEGGQEFFPDGNQLLIDIQRHPKMYQAYIENIKAFVQAGGGGPAWPWGGKLYMAFNSVSKFDRDAFGHYEFQDESIDDAPKHRAVIGGGGR
jgi:hypothetical protein